MRLASSCNPNDLRIHNAIRSRVKCRIGNVADVGFGPNVILRCGLISNEIATVRNMGMSWHFRVEQCDILGATSLTNDVRGKSLTLACADGSGTLEVWQCKSGCAIAAKVRPKQGKESGVLANWH